MKIKFKFDENTTKDDILDCLFQLEKSPTPELPANLLFKICDHLSISWTFNKGSVIQMQHEILEKYPYYQNGYFSIHFKHKGGDERIVFRHDIKKYFSPAVKLILENL